MIEIGMNNITKNFGYKNVLQGFKLEVMTGDRMALVGRNGTGKSTILKLIAGEEYPDKGAVSIRKGSSVGMLEQIPKLHKADTSTEQVLREAFLPLILIKERMSALEELLETEKDTAALDRLMEEYSKEQSRFIAQDGYSMEESFNRIVTGFHLEELLARPFNVLSGGQKTIVNLAVTILKKPDILLLDEPTNHLDIKTLDWFEGFLNKYNGTVLIVSHDRYFLDKVTTKTALLELGCTTIFNGNYTFSIKEQERLMLLEFEQYKNQQKKVNAMKAAIKRFRDWGTQKDNPKFFKKAKELEKRLEKLELIDKPQLEKPKIPIAFSGERSGKEVLKLEDFSFSYGETQLFQGAKLLILEKDRVCLLGNNGTGKTTLIKAILGEVLDYSGRVKLGESAKIGYIPQEIRFQDDHASILDTFRREHSCTEAEARSTLARFFFCGDTVFKRVGSLSGGEKVLLKLALLMQSKVNFLILDEPTNHIDIDTRELLEAALLDFGGTLFFVSHDRFFLNTIPSKIIELSKNKLTCYDGNFDFYLKQTTI